MTGFTTYKINLAGHLRSMGKGFVLWLFCSAMLCLFSLQADNTYQAVLFFSGFAFLFLLPSIILHVMYYAANAGMKLEIDRDLKEITVMDRRGVAKKYSYKEILHSEKNFNIYKKNRVDHANRRMSPWTGYEYIKLRFNDGKILFITSLMADIDMFSVPCMETHYSLFPVLVKKDWETIKNTA